MNKLLLVAGLLLALPALGQMQGAAIGFLPAEEALFRDLVARDPVQAPLPEPPAVGAMIPLAIELQRFPGALMAEVPATRALRYVKTAAGIAVVDPDTRRVVQILNPNARP